MQSEPVRRLRAASDDPWETLGNLMAEMVQMHKRLQEWTSTAEQLNTRLSRIEKMLYGSAGSAAIMLLEYLARRFGLHLIP